ncbi:MAG: ABC transporter permease [Desulfobacterales bacterium]
MYGVKVILKKELSDHFSSYRFIILFALIAMVSLITVYMVGLNIKQDLEGVAKPKYVFLMLFTSSGAGFSLVDFVGFFGPLIGMILGFDTINRERSEGTLSKLLSQPIYRDTVLNGKFLAGVCVIAVMMVSIVLIITGLGLSMMGVIPGFEEVWRIVVYLVISIVYIAFWLGMAMLFSILFRSVATSALAAVAVWIFFSFFISLGANAVAVVITPEAGESNPESLLRRARIERAISLTSPRQLYTDSTVTIMDPMLKTNLSFVRVGMMEQISLSRFSGPLPLIQSILVVLPYIISLLAITVVCFAISYIVFMRQEIRSL